MGGHWKAKESKTFQLYEIAKANLKERRDTQLGRKREVQWISRS